MAYCMLVYLMLGVSMLSGYVEPKGCKDNKLELRDGDGLAHYYFQGTSYSPESKNKHINKDQPQGATWCPDNSKINDSFLEVDLTGQYLLCGVSTQGNGTAFTKTYKIELSSDRIQWAFYQDNGTDKIFEGNDNSSDVVYHEFNVSRNARFVRFYPLTYENNACIQVELYGQRILKDICEGNRIHTNFSQINITDNSNQYKEVSNGTNQWCWPSDIVDPELKVNFRSYTVICALEFDYNGTLEIMYGNGHLNMKIRGIFDSTMFVPQPRMLTTFITLKPIGNFSTCLSWKIFGYLQDVLVNEDVGFQHGNLSTLAYVREENFDTSPQQFDSSEPPSNGRLYNHPHSWCIPDGTKPAYLELILVKKYYVFAVSLQGQLLNDNQYDYTRNIMISYSSNYTTWQQYPSPFKMNFHGIVEKYPLKEPIQARVVRINIPEKLDFNFLCLGAELHGITEEKSVSCKKPSPLGLSKHQQDIPTDRISVSSEENKLVKKDLARLWSDKCWCGKKQDKQSITVDFGGLVSISGVAIQGCSFGYTEEFEIKYSYDDAEFYSYDNDTAPLIYQGNSRFAHKDSITANWLNEIFTARYIQIEIQEYWRERNPCLRLELYGCTTDVAMPIIIRWSEPIFFNRTTNNNITLSCNIRGQTGMKVVWKRDGTTNVTGSSFEKIDTEYPNERVVSGVARTQLVITYSNDKDIYDNFNCTGSRNNSRRLLCKSIYSCSASYPGAITSPQKDIAVTFTPNIVLPDVPGKPSISDVKSRSAVISWMAADDYLESRLQAYVIHIFNGSNTTIIKVMSGIENKSQVYHLKNLAEYTTYSVKISAVSAVSSSNFTATVMFLTLFGPKIKILEEQSLKIVNENDKNVNITCRGESYPTPDVRWRKDGENITRLNATEFANVSDVYQRITPLGRDNISDVYLIVTSKLFLRPNGIKYKDHGNYTCEVLNANESSQPVKRTVEIQFPPRINKGPNNATINEGENISFTCDAEGPPKPTFTWDLVSKNVTFGNNKQSKNKLELVNVRSTGLYQFTVVCIASNKGGSTTANATIAILVKPRVVQLSPNKTALLYANVRLKCEILGNPAAQIWWTKDGNRSHLENVRFENDNKTLLITKAVLANVGEYSCHARNNLSSTRQSLTLSLKALPKSYITGPQTIKLRKGQKDVNITCLGYGYPNPKATWKRNNSEIPETSNSSIGSGIYQIRSTNDTVLDNVTSTLYFNQSETTFEDYGLYTCDVSINPEPDTDSNTINVIFYPIVTIGPKNGTKLQGNDFRFDCEVDGRPRPNTFWLFNNKNISTNHSVLMNGSLLLYSVQNTEEYEGKYSCFAAENEAGQSEKSSAFLTVHVPTRILNISETLKDNVTLKCDVEGDPRPSVTWTKYNHSTPLRPPKFILSKFNQSLTIMNVTLKEQGTYICKAKNKYAEDQRNVIVNVEVRPETKVNSTSAIYLNNINTTVIILCSGRGYPLPVVRWFRDGNEIDSISTSSDVYQVVVQKTKPKFLEWLSTILYVNPDATHSQFGNYTCNATKRRDNEQDHKIVEIVLVPTVSLSKTPNTSTVLESTNVTFTCTADGAPKPTISWRRVNGNISTIKSSITTSQGKSVLVLTKVTNEEEGIYECIAHNRGIPVKKQVDLIVHVKPRIVEHLKNDDVQNGTSYQLNCSAEGDPALQYTWTRNGNQNIPNANLTNRNKTLHLYPVTIDNEGTYKCVVSNIEGTASTAANITVFARPRILEPPVNITQNETEDARFSCAGDGIPTPQVIWRKNGEEIKNSTKNDINTVEERLHFQKSNLTIKNLTYDDRGNYSCTLKNSKDAHVENAVLIVHVPPIAIVQPKYQRVKITKAVRFTCKIYGFPKPQVSWRKDGQQIENNTHYNIIHYGNGSNLIWFSDLRVESITREDTANYSCFLRNVAGTHIVRASLVVLERPDPLYISVKNISSRSVVVEWKKNFTGNTEILHYTLRYFINGSKLDTTMRTLPSNVASYEVKPLKPYSTYIFEITATNEIGTSNVSSKSANTEEDKPSPPQAVQVAVISATSLNVSWQPPEDKNGRILYYMIHFRRVGSDENDTIESVPESKRFKIISHLKPYTNYTVQIFANTSAGRGNGSMLVTQQTKESMPSSPRNLAVQTRSNTTILVSWAPPENENGIIIQYSIHVKEQGVNSSERIVDVSGTTISNLTHSLKPYTNYTFRIRAMTSAGWGNFSGTVTAQTAEGLPSAPLDFVANVQSNQTVRISWEEPTFHNGIITKYHVYYNKTIDNNSIFHEEVPPANKSDYLVENLTPYTVYAFWVRASTSAGIGNKSVTVTNKTYEGVPTEPINVKGVPINSTAIKVNWSEPEHPYGRIILYIVYYKEDSGEESKWKAVNTSDRLAVLSSLSVYTEYRIAVQAFTSVGGGKWSETEQVKTEPGNPIRPTGPPATAKPPEGVKFDPAVMVAVSLPTFSNKSGEIRFYKVIVVMINETTTDEQLTSYFNEEDSKLLSYEQWVKKKEKIGVPYIAFAFKGDSFEKHKELIIGNGAEFSNTFSRRKKRAESKYVNGELVPDKKYAVSLRGYTTKVKFTASLSLEVTTEASSSGKRDSPLDTTTVVVIAVVAVLLLSLILIAVLIRIKKRERHYDGNRGTGMGNLAHPVPLPEFKVYVRSKQFGDEFQKIAKIVDRERTTAATASNMPKNRYKNITPYDYTRVRLQRDESDDDTDYINASFIKGFRVPSKYIATQGPLSHTTNDFWQMVWEQEVSTIVMLTGLEEKNVVKCYQYWPGDSDEKQYGNLTLRLTGETVLADFTTRYFEIKETVTGQVRLVQHLHFTAWPDHGAPKYPGPLLHFHNRYRSGLSGPEPVVVHCSAGCGRTGTFIALDYILHKLDETLRDDPSIDVLTFVREMRGQRILMVQTEEQYKFIHYAVLEAITYPNTEISSADIRVRAAILREKIPGTSKTKGKELFENLQKQTHHEACEDGSSSDNQKKNRSQLLPFDYNRVALSEMPNCTDYINATFICGYQYPINFIATQYPLPNTVNEFWRMILEQRSTVIVAISTKKELAEFGSYWPEDGYTSCGPITVAFESVNNNFAAAGFVVRKFKLTDKRDSIGRAFGVTHFNFVDWTRNDLPAASAILRLLAEVEKAQRSSENTLITVHCSDGGGRTGAFCAMVSCIERVKVENNIDLPMTTRNLQAQRMNMIENEAQYVFCYDVVAAFLASFDDQMYDNFKKGETNDEENYPETSMDDQNRLVSKF